MEKLFQASMNREWQTAWQSGVFRKRLIWGLILLFITLGTFPFFFSSIEKREGTQINDWVLNHLPAYPVSLPIFIIIWSATLFTFIRAIQDPRGIMIVFLWSYVIMSISRLVVITAVPLNPPAGLLELKDPISNTFYGMKVVTKDLFYSGHTSTVFLMFLCVKKRKDKITLLTATLLVGFLLLLQHVHYTIDVLAAPVFTFIIYFLVKRAFRLDAPEKTN